MERSNTVVTPKNKNIKNGLSYSEDRLNHVRSMSKGGYSNKTELSPEDEEKFQSWRKTLPKNLQTDDEGYDLRGAYTGEMKPILVDDGTYHMGGRDPKSGKILKHVNHPTFYKTVESEDAGGYEISFDPKTRRYYSQPKRNSK